MHALCRESTMAFTKPEEKIVMQGYMDTSAMFMINEGFCKVHIEDKTLSSKKTEDV